ncbi:Fanconi anemia group F protein [Rhineura floridana]|uniref:Fanconi anemia group F protein n=1 Tax=Rhineura floridana TaxID=261503 RepID=UPI002AC8482A|nr:Fanconi anemia group F protein [Rhineura floridana]XP_061468251.1 Fanconi anemia group F protein [Rhineura floridana]XP_061468253.1 Fanconi anemia group F protein [Rhineura floridana]
MKVGPVAMETLLSQAEQLPSLLAASRLGLVQSWDPATLKRALSWGRFFHQLHSRLPAQPGLQAALERRLRRAGPLSLSHLKRCPELMGLALLENRALPSTARYQLLRILLLPAAGGEEPFIPLLARRRAASQLLLSLVPPTEASTAEQWKYLPVRSQAQLLLSRLQEEGYKDGEGSCNISPSASTLLEQLPCGPTLYKAVAVALLEPGGEVEAKATLLPWLLLGGDPVRLATFCRLLPATWVASLCGRYPELCTPYLTLLSTWGSRLSYDPLHGEWRASGLEKDEVPWQEMRERIGCLYQESEPLKNTILTQLRHLKAQDGDFEVRGLSVWTDLLLDVEKPASEKKLRRTLPQSFVRTQPTALKT